MTPRRSIMVIALLALLVGGCGGSIGGAASPSPAPSGSSPASGAGCPTSQPAPLPAGQTRTVTVQTDKGSFTIKVRADLSPVAAGNFVALASCGFYDGVVFHRAATLDDGTPFVIQGGDPTGTGRGGPGYTITDEPVLSQFNTYQIIGTVDSGMETVDAIYAAANGQEQPANPVHMTKVTVANP